MRRLSQALIALGLTGSLVAGVMLMTPAAEGFPADQLRVFIQCGTTGIAPHNAQVDPIVSPNAVSQHQHTFFGSTRTSDNPSYVRMVAPPLASNCDTRRDTAGYWVPQARNSNTGEVLAAQRMNVYYTNVTDDPDMVAWPPNFMAVSDDIEILAPGGTVEAGAGVRIWFRRQCWDGTLKMASPDEYRQHTRIPSGQNCSAGFNTLLPKMHYNARWPDLSSMEGWIASDAPLGWHGDFWNTWHQPSLEALVEACLVPSNANVGCGRMTDANMGRLLSDRGVALPPAPTIGPTPSPTVPPTTSPPTTTAPPTPTPPPVDPVIQSLIDDYNALPEDMKALFWALALADHFDKLTPEQQMQFEARVG